VIGFFKIAAQDLSTFAVIAFSSGYLPAQIFIPSL